jgi:hypothetical protein
MLKMASKEMLWHPFTMVVGLRHAEKLETPAALHLREKKLICSMAPRWSSRRNGLELKWV